LQAHGDKEVARAFRRTERQARRPDVDEALLLHCAANCPDDGRGQAQVPLHLVPAQIEIAIAETQDLVDVLLVELERQRLGARDQREAVDLNLDLAGGDVAIDDLGRPAHDLALSLQHELGADVVRGLRGFGRTLRVDDQLHPARVVAEVDEDETAVVTPPRRPARDGHAASRVVRSQLAAAEIAPVRHPVIRSARPSSGVVQSSLPCSRTVACAPSTITVHPAASLPACVI
jgi:hypothetical protein